MNLLHLDSVSSFFQIKLLFPLFLMVGIITSPALAQNRPKQLREEILNSQKEAETKSAKSTKKKELSKPQTVLPPLTPVMPIVNPLENEKATLIYLENSETVTFDKFLNPDIQVLKGNVQFRHENALMYCDSAYFYKATNSLDAFGNVRMVQGDTLFVYGNVLYYDGFTKLARLRKNVRLENRKTVLTTDSMNYDRITNLAYYYTGGKIKDEVNTLTSVWGQYSPATDQALFKDKVKLVNKNYTMDADTLKYNTKTNIANIVGPTHILYKNETDIYSTRGWYNTSTERSMLLDRSLVIHKDGKTLTGDSIFYDKKQKYAEAFQRVILTDTVQKTTLTGNFVSYNENTEFGMANDSALLVEWSTQDSLFLHADTLFTFKDSVYNAARAYYNVRFFRNDLQGVCDSLYYSARDSVVRMYKEPVLWAEDFQITGDSISGYIKNKKIDHIRVLPSAIAIQQFDSIHFNQISGKEIVAYLDSNQLKRVHVNGNAETIYYPLDEKDSTLIGLNKTQSSYVVVYFKDKKVDRIVLTNASNGIMYPLNQLSGGDIYLKNYIWLDYLRPKSKKEVFLKISRQPAARIGTSSLMNTTVNQSSSENTERNSRKSPGMRNP
ncbi:MAG TPA: OstA-like protein [Paludibacteraceae bacterium]|jgi:lipopolysaccharide export system protein LptA|nr:OstA-like protein [Paludibacteraceae bacterium]HOJ66956.1 OstA-like protein [Paludibacteraceae bacterium]HRS24612.1 OstA-like protein [Paludibacteraceae bacterium]HRT78994.1 OstA-like protein [Paludibacteraceae bacterium]